MIKALLGSSEEPQTLLLGLSEMNIQKLKEGMPIKIEKLGKMPYEIIIMYGKTEGEMEKMIRENVKK